LRVVLIGAAVMPAASAAGSTAYQALLARTILESPTPMRTI
jgi:hypothetical protein